MNNFMIDLETMGLRPTSAILSIGIVLFDKHNIVDRFYTPVSLKSCLEHGLTTDKSTEDWWSKQSDVARRAWDTPQAPSLLEALTRMTFWIRSHSSESKTRPWGNGSDFDLVLLANAFRAINADPPWKYYNHMCFRTLKNTFKVEPVQRVGTYHNAVDDAETQALHMQRIWQSYELPL